MADEWENITIGGRVYIPLLHLDIDGRQVATKVRDRTNPPFNTRVVKPYACSECAALTIDPKVHNEAHDGPACELCGCTENRACEGGCSWASTQPRLCSKCFYVPAGIDLVKEFRDVIVRVQQRRAEADHHG